MALTETLYMSFSDHPDLYPVLYQHADEDDRRHTYLGGHGAHGAHGYHDGLEVTKAKAKTKGYKGRQLVV